MVQLILKYTLLKTQMVEVYWRNVWGRPSISPSNLFSLVVSAITSLKTLH